MFGVSGPLPPLLITLGSAVSCAVLVTLVRLQPALFTAVIAAGGFAWLVGNLLWLLGQPIPVAVLWWVAFLVLTIAGERLELSRLLRRSRPVQFLCLASIAPLVLGATAGSWQYEAAMQLAGLGMLAVALWLLRYDIARRRIKAGGPARFMALTLLSGYVWLGVAGLLTLWYGGVMGGPYYDAILHSVFLGFVFAMIVAHAPIIFPAVLRVPMACTPRFYSHLILLHASLLLRMAGDLSGWWEIRRWGGMLNVLVLLPFILDTALAVRQGQRMAAAQTVRR